MEIFKKSESLYIYSKSAANFIYRTTCFFHITSLSRQLETLIKKLFVFSYLRV